MTQMTQVCQDDTLALAKFYLLVGIPCDSLWDGYNMAKHVLVSYIIKGITLLVEN